ncbi:MAG: hypothetical protein ACRDID_09400, partial [Ktedonobacterales bacterium]
ARPRCVGGGLMDSQPTAPPDAADAPRADASLWPRWTLLRRVRARRHNHADEREPRLVGVRDQKSGDVRIFRVYQPKAREAQPPDPEPPPAAPAQARRHVETNDRDSETVADGRRERAA